MSDTGSRVLGIPVAERHVGRVIEFASIELRESFAQGYSAGADSYGAGSAFLLTVPFEQDIYVQETREECERWGEGTDELDALLSDAQASLDRFLAAIQDEPQ